MLKRYYTDLVTEAPVPAKQAYRFFTRHEDWADWSGAIHKVKLFGDEWRKGATLIFWPKVGNLPPVPVPVKILSVKPDQSITWGLDLPGAKLKHRFSFIPVGDGFCRIHHEEWSEGLLTLAVWPAGGLINKFNKQFAAELAAMF